MMLIYKNRNKPVYHTGQGLVNKKESTKAGGHKPNPGTTNQPNPTTTNQP